MSTWYVRTDGSNSNTPTGNETPPIDGTVAFATLAYAINQDGTGNASFADGDEVRVCADAVHGSQPTLLIQETRDGTDAAPITIQGAAADGSIDGTRAVLDYTGNGSYGIHLVDGVSHIRLANLEIRNAGDHGVWMTGLTQSTCFFYNCYIHNNAGSGIYHNITGGIAWRTVLYNCDISNNGGAGFGISNDNRWGPVAVDGCVFADNSGNGLEFGTGANSSSSTTVSNCLVVRNANGIHGRGTDSVATTRLVILNCTFDQQIADAINLTAMGTDLSAFSIQNTVISNSGGYGINVNAGVLKEYISIGESLFYQNTLGHMSNGKNPIDDNWTPFGLIIDQAPQFIGSNDLEPASGSPLINAAEPGITRLGTGHLDIGALQRRQEAGGGGGGVIVHPGMTGGIRG